MPAPGCAAGDERPALAGSEPQIDVRTGGGQIDARQRIGQRRRVISIHQRRAVKVAQIIRRIPAGNPAARQRSRPARRYFYRQRRGDLRAPNSGGVRQRRHRLSRRRRTARLPGDVESGPGCAGSGGAGRCFRFAERGDISGSRPASPAQAGALRQQFP